MKNHLENIYFRLCSRILFYNLLAFHLFCVCQQRFVSREFFSINRFDWVRKPVSLIILNPGLMKALASTIDGM